jgi:hypothetical protein
MSAAFTSYEGTAGPGSTVTGAHERHHRHHLHRIPTTTPFTIKQADRRYVIADAVVTDAVFRVRATSPPEDARLSGIVFQRHEGGIHVVWLGPWAAVLWGSRPVPGTRAVIRQPRKALTNPEGPDKPGRP